MKANRVIIRALETPDRTSRWITREKCRGENRACGIFDSCCIVKFVELHKPLVSFFESEESDRRVFRIVADCRRIAKGVE